MKFGIISYKYTNIFIKSDIENKWNVGEYIQSYAAKELYRKMGIRNESIIEISEEELTTYRGEYVVILMNAYGGLVTYRLSPYIIPVFCGFNYGGYIDDELKLVLEKNAPIGCRDQQTLENIRSRGVEAFLSGCITITLDKRETNPEKGKVFFVDTPASLEKYIPEDILLNKKEVSHIVEASYMPFDIQMVKRAWKVTEERLELYKREAKLVVTGRLHCAAPCLAMGIPVIVVKKNRDVNMSWFDKFVHIYTEDEFQTIDWNVTAPDIEVLKQQIIDVFMTKINESIENRKKYYDLSFYYESREYFNYNNKLISKLKRIVEKIGKEDFAYAIWGLGDGGNIAYQMIRNQFPKAKCILAVDRYKKGAFYGNNIELPEELQNKSVDYIFVTTYNGRKDAVELLSNINKKKGEEWEFLISRVGGEDQYFSGI